MAGGVARENGEACPYYSGAMLPEERSSGFGRHCLLKSFQSLIHQINVAVTLQSVHLSDELQGIVTHLPITHGLRTSWI